MEMCGRTVLVLFMAHCSLHRPGTGAASGAKYLVVTTDQVRAVSAWVHGCELYNCSDNIHANYTIYDCKDIGGKIVMKGIQNKKISIVELHLM